ncbi:MAG: Tim44 domain-containing protein [Mesorhizobium sp.]
MMRLGRTRFIALLSSLFVAFTLVSVDFAEARRGGSFGSRGNRTFQAPAPTRTAPTQAAPVERSMTPNPGTTSGSRQQQPGQNAGQQQRPGMFGGLGGSLMRGILIGGVIGMLMGYGFGGMAGALGFILQLLLFGLIAALVIGWLRSRRQGQPAMAGGPASTASGNGFGNVLNRETTEREDTGSAQAGSTSNIGALGRIGGLAASEPAPSARVEEGEITLSQDDLDAFERRLGDVQRAFADEDHAALRKFTTPEMVSYFSEELADNAKRGLRNDVSDVRLVQADIAEAWSEGQTEYATAAFEYESRDVLRDRQTGEVAEGEDEVTVTVELWTFVRKRGEEWKLSAIQQA